MTIYNIKVFNLIFKSVRLLKFNIRKLISLSNSTITRSKQAIKISVTLFCFNLHQIIFKIPLKVLWISVLLSLKKSL